MGLFNYLKSSILSKVVMSVTGVILLLFIIGHCIGNMQVFIGKETFNTYAHFLQSLGDLLWIIRIVLILTLLFHIITSIYLKLTNLSAKPVKYEIKKYVKAGLTSRTMIWTGIMIFAFLVYHLLHFTIGTIDNANFSHNHPEVYGPGLIFTRHDAYFMVIKGFQQPLISLFYVIGVLILGFHLNHAIQSAFQTLGLNNPKYFPAIVACSTIVSTLITICYISIPVSILLGLVGGNL